jgi:hypothetical protein
MWQGQKQEAAVRPFMNAMAVFAVLSALALVLHWLAH